MEVYTYLLRLATSWIEQVKAEITPLIPAALSSFSPLSSEPEVVQLKDESNPSFLLNLLISLNMDTPPHPTQLFWCDSATITASKYYLESFLARCTHFPYMRFFLLGVEHLSVTHRELVLNWISELYRQQQQTKIGHLFLVFRQSSKSSSGGVEVFSFLKEQEEATSNQLKTSGLKEYFNRTKKSRGIEELYLVQDRPGVGKSTFIKQQMERYTSKTTIR